MTESPDPPAKIDIADFGFNHPAELHLAAVGLLKHFQRLGIQVLPAANKSDSLFGRLHFLANQPAGESSLSTPDPSRSAILGAAPASPDTKIDQPNSGSRSQQSPPSKLQSASPAAATPAAPASRIAVSPIAAGAKQAYSLPVLNSSDRQQELDTARQRVASCRACPELVIGRRNTVYGEGNLMPRVCFFGEAPGAEEDQQGKPFVGNAGQLLTKMIQACTFTREECYILNTIKCRPPGNRTPNTQEVENCRGFFEHQLEVLQPEYIVCLGLVAANALLQTTQPVGRLRGVFHKYKTSKVIVTYHPAYLLRNNDAKRAAWADLQMLMRDMGIEPNARK